MRTAYAVLKMFGALALVGGHLPCLGQASDPAPTLSVSKICTVSFNKDSRRPARLGDDARECLASAAQRLKSEPETKLYLVATADSKKDNHQSNGTARIEQDMSGTDLRYADVAAYRAVNTKAYMVRWLHLNPKQIIPVTAYDNNQSLEIYSVRTGTNFKSVFGKPTAPIMEKPCTAGPCASGFEEYLVAQQRTHIPQ